MRNILIAVALTFVAISLIDGTAVGVEVYRPYFLASDVEPDVYVRSEVFFLRPWGSNTPSSSYIDVCTVFGAKYCGRLVKISDYEIALSRGYVVKRTGQRVEKQVVVPKSDVMIARIYW
jgi:hypothetical protein